MDGSANVIPGHNIAYVILGTIILAFGWLAYDAGSTLAISDLRSSIIAANTFLAGVAGAVIVILYSYIKTKKSNVAEACNGALAGFVAISRAMRICCSLGCRYHWNHWWLIDVWEYLAG